MPRLDLDIAVDAVEKGATVSVEQAEVGNELGQVRLRIAIRR
jgi:hypothetical protein